MYVHLKTSLIALHLNNQSYITVRETQKERFINKIEKLSSNHSSKTLSSNMTIINYRLERRLMPSSLLQKTMEILCLVKSTQTSQGSHYLSIWFQRKLTKKARK